MSTNLSVYAGVYLRVYMPKEKYIDRDRICPACEKFMFSKFCPYDGNETLEIEKQRQSSFYDFCQSVFGDGDRFSTRNIDSENFVIIMANLDSQPGHAYVNDEKIEQSLPKEDYSGDWEILTIALDKNGIKYDKCFGIVSYWS